MISVFMKILDQIIQEEPLDFIDVETRGLIASIGIVKGKVFNPDQRMRRILTEAVKLGNAYSRANTTWPRDPGAYIYKDTDSEWVMGYADKDTYFNKDGARRYDSRLWLHYNAICVTPSMAVTKQVWVLIMVLPIWMAITILWMVQKLTDYICLQMFR